MTTKADQVVDKAADHLQEMADKAAAEGGVAAKVAQPLADDAEFLRKLKPSLIKARAKGMAPTNQKPGHGSVSPHREAPGERPRPEPVPRSSASPSPSGIAVAKIIDWSDDADAGD